MKLKEKLKDIFKPRCSECKKILENETIAYIDMKTYCQNCNNHIKYRNRMKRLLEQRKLNNRKKFEKIQI